MAASTCPSVMVRSTASRVVRRIRAIPKTLSEAVGRIMVLRLPHKSSPSGTKPPTFSPSDQREKIKISALPSTNSGTLAPSAPTRRPRAARGEPLPSATPLQTPNGNPIAIANVNVNRETSAVTGARRRNSSMTGLRVTIDVPKSPCNKAASHLKNWTAIDSSRPNLAAIMARASAVANGPRSTSAKPPGIRRSETNTSNDTPSIVNAAIASRGRRK